MADSYNELFGLGSHSPDANLEIWCPLQDDAATADIVNEVGADITDGLGGGSTTTALSVAGPNSWLTKALDLSTVGDELLLPNFANMAAGEFYLGVRIRPNSWSADETILFDKRVDISNFFTEFSWQFTTSGNTRYVVLGGTGNNPGSATAATAGVWSSIALRRNASNVVSSTKNGSAVSGTIVNSGSTAHADTLYAGGIGRRSQPEPDASLADIHFFSREITDAESLQIHSGPEPVNSVAPVMSGTPTEGLALTTTSGTWGLGAPFSGGSNGTITYSYQWTRSDDAGGTGEADIGGATSSSYTLTLSDVGKYIRCRVRASNDGGFDAAADTTSNMSAVVAASGGGGVSRLVNGGLINGILINGGLVK